MIYKFEDIQELHIEISSLCNAHCPLCPRNFYGYPVNNGYIERNLTLEDIQKILPTSFIQQLNICLFNGNFGDIVMNPETPDIVEYLLTVNPNLSVHISTNGGARSKEFWQKLGQVLYNNDSCVFFAIDGLEDTHSIYRQGTVYSTVINNARTFIEAGGRAVWKMIRFDHNAHQIETAKQLSKQLGFKEFALVEHGRDTGPIYNKHQELIGTLGKPEITEFTVMFERHGKKNLTQANLYDTMKPIECDVKRSRSLYITSTGEVYPCCYLGFHPKTYGQGWSHVANEQLRPFIQRNNAFEYPLEECIDWFNNVSNSWDKPDYASGRIIICNDVCGRDNRKKIWTQEIN